MKKILLLFILANSTLGSFAQYFGNPFYNPYNNPYNVGAQLGNAIGQAVATKNKYGRNQLRKAINEWGQCNNGSLSIEHGGVAICGSNGYFTSASVDDRIKSKLKSINSARQTINDINITEQGYFIIVYDDDQWYGALPSTVSSKLNTISSGTTFKSISFTDGGKYAILTSSRFYSNESAYQEFYDDHKYDYGTLYSVNICGNGAVFCYSDGVRFVGSIPEKVKNGFDKFSGTAKFVKFNSHGDYLICSSSGGYSYSIADANEGGYATTTSYNYLAIKAKEKAEKERKEREEKAAREKAQREKVAKLKQYANDLLIKNGELLEIESFTLLHPCTTENYSSGTARIKTTQTSFTITVPDESFTATIMGDPTSITTANGSSKLYQCTLGDKKVKLACSTQYNEKENRIILYLYSYNETVGKYLVVGYYSLKVASSPDSYDDLLRKEAVNSAPKFGLG